MNEDTRSARGSIWPGIISGIISGILSGSLITAVYSNIVQQDKDRIEHLQTLDKSINVLRTAEIVEITDNDQAARKDPSKGYHSGASRDAVDKRNEAFASVHVSLTSSKADGKLQDCVARFD